MIRCALFLLFALATSLRAEDNAVALARAAAAELGSAFEALTAAESSDDRVAALTHTIRAYEEGLAAFRIALRRAAIRERALRITLEGKRARIARLLAVMQTMENAAAPLLLLHPAGPVETARAGMILSDVTPVLQAEANVLKAELEELVVLNALREGAAGTLRDGLSGAQNARTELSKAVADRTDLLQRVVDAPESLSALVTSANTLEAFAEGLAGGGGGDPDDFIAMKGQLALPLKGKLLRAFNEADAANIRRPGMIIAASSEALVTTPWPATIRYAGPLLDYGNVMILEPAEGYLLVLAGLAQLFGGVGDVLSAGTPLGLMGGDATQTSTILALTGEESGSEHPETLYIELRVGDRPVDPVPWFRMDKD